jgi:possible bacteriophage Mu GP27-like protein
MPKRSTVKALPPAVKDWLDAALVGNNFSGYRELEEELKSRGFDISRSAVHRYGQALERRLASIRASTEAAKVISENISSEKGTQSDAILEMIQSEVFQALMQLEEIGEEDDPMKRLAALSFVGKNISPLIGASINLKKYQADVKAKAQTAAKEVEKIVKKGGLSADTADEIRQKILGITA